jgi:hypothetical protein
MLLPLISNRSSCVGFEILTLAVMKFFVSLDIRRTVRRLAIASQERITSILRVGKRWRKKAVFWQEHRHLLAKLFLTQTIFFPEEAGNTFCRNVHLYGLNGTIFQDFANFISSYSSLGARRSIVVKALCYQPEGRGFETR